MSYSPGIHVVATLITSDALLLQKHEQLKVLVNSLIEKYKLQKLGEVYHDFVPGGFTGVVCLSESHLSIHTWPEHGIVNVDIYLSNFLRENDGTVALIYKAIQDHFAAAIKNEQIIRR